VDDTSFKCTFETSVIAIINYIKKSLSSNNVESPDDIPTLGTWVDNYISKNGFITDRTNISKYLTDYNATLPSAALEEYGIGSSDVSLMSTEFPGVPPRGFRNRIESIPTSTYGSLNNSTAVPSFRDHIPLRGGESKVDVHKYYNDLYGGDYSLFDGSTVSNFSEDSG